MNFAQAQARHDNSLPRDHDTFAGERRDALIADQIRTSLDPMDRLIVEHADALKENFESTNQIIIAAHGWKFRRMGDLNEWDIALSDGMFNDNARTIKVRELLMTGTDDCQLGKLAREIAMDSFAARRVSAAEDEVMS
jgi:hypothetical protein